MRFIIIVFAVLYFGIDKVLSNSISTASIDKNKAITFLIKYGYIDKASNDSLPNAYNNIDEETYSDALLNFQENFGLKNDGLLNKETLDKIIAPRCGVADIAEMNKMVRQWPPNATVRYSLHFHQKYFKEANDLVKKAFNEWGKITNLNFVHDRIQPNILISFAKRVHKFQNFLEKNTTCNFNFDGKGQVLAHAYYPPELYYYNTSVVKEIHMDEEEHWWFDANDKMPSTHVDFYAVLLHEIGHSLGLDHSKIEDALMYPWYTSIPKLHHSDVAEIEKLYGKKQFISNVTPTTTTSTTTTSTTPTAPTTTSTTSTTTPAPEITLPPSFCTIANKVKLFFVYNKRFYAIYDKWIWGKNLEAEVFEEPQLISKWFPMIRGNQIQGLYQNLNGDIEVYVGFYVYTIDAQRMAVKNNTIQHTFFQRHPDRLITLVATYTANLLFFTESKSYFYKTFLRNELMPNDLDMHFKTEIIGFPSTINGAFRYTNGIIYLLDDQNMYEYDEFRNIVVKSYKKDFTQIGIKCFNQSLLQKLQTLVNKMLT